MDLLDIATGFIGTLFGAGVALLFGFLGSALERRAREVNELNVLLAELHYRRAISDFAPRSVPLPGADFEQATRSVIAMREMISTARKALRLGSRAFDPLGKMTAACNDYLESSAADSNRYQFELLTLRTDLQNATKAVWSVSRRVKRLLPGEGAFPPVPSPA